MQAPFQPFPDFDPDNDISSLERATLDAVAPPEISEIDGWLLPFDNSTIGRATSAVPLRHHDLHADQVSVIEECYRAHELRPAFRVADVASLAPLHLALKGLGYQPEQPTLVQISSIKAMRAICLAAPACVLASPEPQWSCVYIGKGFDPVDGAHRVQALSRSQHAVYAYVELGGQSVAAGTAALSRGWCSIHGMRTVARWRNQGLASRILGGLADTAAARGVDRVFLQVEESNTAALALYRSAGFKTAWRYHYWRHP
jgi:GNAT superfamily N-acetyltransferase